MTVKFFLIESTQKKFEHILLEILKKANLKYKKKYLVTAGGCALNGVANARIEEELDFSGQFIQPASSDDGTSLGAALYCHYEYLGNKRDNIFSNCFLGGEYTDTKIRSTLKQFAQTYVYEPSLEALLTKTANLITENKVVGFFQGRSEWGPRALGNRSILANPNNQNMKNIINSKIKRRESFRPFAPSVLEEDVQKYFVRGVKSPFMMHVIKFKDSYKNIFPAVTHVDDTGRIQTVSNETNPIYYRLLKKIKKMTGHGILLNTSFNENEPIVETPEEAIKCFIRTDMDALIIGNFVVEKHSF